MPGTTTVLGLTTIVGTDSVDLVSHMSNGIAQQMEDLLTGAAYPASNLVMDFNSASNRTLTLQNSGAGAAGLIASDKGGQVHNVVAYGAIGDGTTDDTAALAAAIAAVGSRGGTVFVPYGIYRFTSQLSVGAGITLAGAGHTASGAVGSRASTVLLKDGTFDGILLAGDAAVVRDLQVDGAAGNTGDGIYVRHSRCTVEHVAVTNQGGSGIRIGGKDASRNANIWRLYDTVSLSNGGHGVHVLDFTGGGDVSVNANAGIAVGLDLRSNAGDGIRIDNAIDNLILGLMAASNTGYGFVVTGTGAGNTFILPYTEANGNGDGILDTNSLDNLVWGCRSNTAGDGFTDNGTRNLILGRLNKTGVWTVKQTLDFLAMRVGDTTVSGDWRLQQKASDRGLEITLDGTTADNVDVRLLHSDNTKTIRLGIRALMLGNPSENATPVYQHLHGSIAINFGTITAGASAFVDVTLTGVAVGDTVLASPPDTWNSGFLWSTYSVNPNTVRVIAYNATGGNADPDGAGLNWSIDAWGH